MPPPAKVLADAEVRLMVPVPVTVRLVDVAVFHAVLEPASVHVPDPTAMVLVFELDDETEPADIVTLYVPASNIPSVIVKEVAADVNASCKVNDPPGELIVMPPVKV